MTVLSLLSTFSHHGMVFVPLGYKNAFSELTNVEEVHGGGFTFSHSLVNFKCLTSDRTGSPWGAGTIASSAGTRLPSKLELQVAETQGKAFYELLARTSFRQPEAATES